MFKHHSSNNSTMFMHHFSTNFLDIFYQSHATKFVLHQYCELLQTIGFKSIVKLGPLNIRKGTYVFNC
jgi:hypothetical protein